VPVGRGVGMLEEMLGWRDGGCFTEVRVWDWMDLVMM